MDIAKQEYDLGMEAGTLAVQGTFVLLYALPDSNGLTESDFPPPGVHAIPPREAEAHLEYLRETEQRLLGNAYHQAQRITRRAVGRVALPDMPGAPAYADVFLIVHTTGVAVWEAWLSAPLQPFAAQRWIEWLRLDTPQSLAAHLWTRLAALCDAQEANSKSPELYLPLCLLSVPRYDLADVITRQGADLVRLLHLNRLGYPFKQSFVESELRGDFCFLEGGLSLLSRRAAIDLHAPAEPAGRRELHGAQPLLIALELLALERAVLRKFNNHLAREATQHIDDLVQLKRDVLDGLEEYYGTLATGNAFSAEAMTRGEELLGITDLYDSVVDRLEMVTFSITTRAQRNTARIGFWLTVIFGAIETGFVASSIATWHYANDLGAVLGWTIGMTLATASLIAVLLYPRTR